MAEKADFVIYNFPMPDGFLKNITEGEVAKLSVPANEYEVFLIFYRIFNYLSII